MVGQLEPLVEDGLTHSVARGWRSTVLGVGVAELRALPQQASLDLFTAEVRVLPWLLLKALSSGFFSLCPDAWASLPLCILRVSFLPIHSRVLHTFLGFQI